MSLGASITVAAITAYGNVGWNLLAFAPHAFSRTYTISYGAGPGTATVGPFALSATVTATWG